MIQIDMIFKLIPNGIKSITQDHSFLIIYLEKLINWKKKLTKMITLMWNFKIKRKNKKKEKLHKLIMFYP